MSSALDTKSCHHSQSRHIYKVPYNRLLHNLMSVLLLPLKAKREMHSSNREQQADSEQLKKLK